MAGVSLADAVVYAVPAAAAVGTTGHATIDQVNRQFTPRVNVVQTGTAVDFPNSDNIRHSVYSFSPAKVFTLKLYAGKPSDPVIFDKPGLVVLGCNIHDHMVAYLMVVDTPYFALTDANGEARFTNLPGGDYTLHAWHTPMGEDQQLDQSLHIDANGSAASRTLRLNAGPDEQAEMKH